MERRRIAPISKVTRLLGGVLMLGDEELNQRKNAAQMQTSTSAMRKIDLTLRADPLQGNAHEADAVVAARSNHGLVPGLHGERRVAVRHEQGVFDLRRLAHEPDQLEVRVLEVTNDVRRRG